jgi:phosphatidylglycerol:prolipoprotein diacylglycerol transferase
MLPNISILASDFSSLFKIHPFPVLVAIAVITGCELAFRRAKRLGLNTRIMIDGLLWTIGTGFVLSHWVSEIFYYPERVLENPLILLMVWGSMSSYGGFFGGILGGFIYFRIKKVPLLPYIEAMLFGFVPAWIIGRLGCTIAFDHPGRLTDFFLGMVDGYGVVRHNLGLYEMIWTVVLTVVLYRLKNVRPFEGFHIALIILLYTPVRILLDTLRVGEMTYGELIPSQYFSIVLLGLGFFLIVRGWKERTRNTQDLRKKAVRFRLQ